MLVLSRKKNERIRLRVAGKVVWLMVVEIRGGRDGNKVRLGIEADEDVEIDREEVALARDADVAAATTQTL